MMGDHYCSFYNESMAQCVVYDNNTANARLMGVMYIVTPDVFANFADDEKKLWHSHAYEVQSGMLIVPEITQSEEHDLMGTIVHTYGKMIHTWDTMMNDAPTGVP